MGNGKIQDYTVTVTAREQTVTFLDILGRQCLQGSRRMTKCTATQNRGLPL
jgi:hypothetical protein